MKRVRIGGQAVMEGVMMKNGDRYAVAVRKPDKDIEVKVVDYVSMASRSVFFRVPIIRGVVNFVESLVIGVKTLTYSASFYDDEEPEKAEKEKKEKKEKAKKEKAPKVKKEKPPKEIDRTPPLPKKPVILIFIMALSILILILLGSSNLQYGQDMQQAKDDFASGSYVTAFQTIAGSSVKGKDENFYKKAQVLASIQREYQSYESLSGINENEMALDALIRGYGRCVDGADLAQEYEITDEMAGLKNQILQQLSDHFGVSEEKAAELHAMTKRTDYTKAIQGILAAAGLE